MMRDVLGFGQVFTPAAVVSAMLALRRRIGGILEPAAGDGAIAARIPDCVAIEIDRRHAPPGALVMDFFAFSTSERFDTVIANPPYVRNQDIHADTAALLDGSLFDGRSNLFLFFIEKSLRHLNPGGELIFITPRSLWSATSAAALNRRLFALGTITDVLELGDSRVFDGAVPNCAIWRFERDNFSRRTRYATIGAADGDLATALMAPAWEEREFVEAGGHLLFLRDRHTIRLGDLLSVRVGAVSGADRIYTTAGRGDREFVCSETARSGRTRAMIWQAPGSFSPNPALDRYKDQLIARRIRRFDESNWWQWGRGYPETAAPRIYVNAKTRNRQPFFLHPCEHFDGSVLALFPKHGTTAASALPAITHALNAVDWEASGFVCDGRFLFSQRSLEHAPLPALFDAFRGQ